MPLRQRVVMLTTLVSLVVSLVFATTGAPAAPGVTDTAVAAATDESSQSSSEEVARSADADEAGRNSRRDSQDRGDPEKRRDQGEPPAVTITITQPPTTSTTEAPPSTTTTRVPTSSTTTTSQVPVPTTTTRVPTSSTTTTRVPPTQPPPSTTTTTTPPMTQPPLGQSVGVVGCSNTAQGIEGVEMVTGPGDTGFWAFTDVGMPGVEGGIGGGSLEKWANPSESYWDYLDVMAQENPSTNTIWYQICIRASARVGAGAEPTAGEFADADFVISEIKKRFPSAKVYVSPLNDYLNGHVCGGTGEHGVGVATQLADYLAGSGAALRGPTMSPMAVSDTTDGCHASDAFQPTWGVDLLAFFG